MNSAASSILILPFHGMGHFNAVFGIARHLRSSANVTFAGTGFFAQHVRNAGFDLRILHSLPFGLGLESWIHEIRKTRNPRLANIRDRWNDTMYRERRQELAAVVGEVRPTHVLVDVQQATDVIVLKSIDPQLRVTVVSVAPPYYLLPGIPPANCTALPNEPDRIADGHRDAMRSIRANKWKQRFRYLGMDDHWLIDRRLTRNGMLKYRSPFPSLFNFAIQGVEQLVLTYREFDFVPDMLPDLTYVGAHADLQLAESDTERFTSLASQIRNEGKKVVYCSFGTVPGKRDITPFLVKIGEAARRVNAVVIASARLPQATRELLEKNDALVVCDWVPQSHLLQLADVFITHGGINSVHDAIRCQVPMLVYPAQSNYDQNGNGARVFYHGLGLRGTIDGDSTDDIARHLSELLEDGRFRKALGEFRTKTAHYSIDDVAKRIL